MTDDAGYGVRARSAGRPTPAMDRIAKAGLRYTQFHSCALCSPTRAALITGATITRWATGQCGELATASRLRFHHRCGERHRRRDPARNGYDTSWFGKNHNTPGFQESESGPFDQWPSGWASIISMLHGRRKRPVAPLLVSRSYPDFPVGRQARLQPHHDMADDAIRHQRRERLRPNKPFFCYYVPGATHSPHHPTRMVEKFKGKF